MLRTAIRRMGLVLGVTGVILAVSLMPLQATMPMADGWGTIKGQIVYDGTPPTPEQLKVDKDTDHCLAKGPLMSEAWTVDAKTKGVKWAAVFLKPARGQPLPVHDTLKAVPSEPALLDQPLCVFSPHVLAVREGQKLLAKNPAPIPHNVILSGLSNTANVTTPAGGSYAFNLNYEPGPVTISCGAHPWMKGYVWVFKHPYFAITDAEGRFEIKLAPAGKRQLVFWHEVAGYFPDKNGQMIDVTPNGVTDLGVIKVK